MDSSHPANAHNADQSGDTRILSGTIWKGAAYTHSHSSVSHPIEDSGVQRVWQPSPLLRKHGLPVYRGNGQSVSTRSSATPTRHGMTMWSLQQSLLIQNWALCPSSYLSMKQSIILDGAVPVSRWPASSLSVSVVVYWKSVCLSLWLCGGCRTMEMTSRTRGVEVETCQATREQRNSRVTRHWLEWTGNTNTHTQTHTQTDTQRDQHWLPIWEHVKLKVTCLVHPALSKQAFLYLAEDCCCCWSVVCAFGRVGRSQLFGRFSVVFGVFEIAYSLLFSNNLWKLTCLATEAHSDSFEFICAIQITLMYVYVCMLRCVRQHSVPSAVS